MNEKKDCVPYGAECYGLQWVGKQDAIRAASTPARAVLVPDVAKSVSFDDAQNVFIEGDNLEALKLLQGEYFNAIKLIYIDPPYNTGSEFVYNDDYGKHSQWLSMMYPRLALARNLLRTDGFIFISIDDNEVDYLKLLCDSIFGEDGFIGRFIWKKGGTGKQDSRFGVTEHEYILAYAKSVSSASYNPDTEAKVTTWYNHEDENGRYSLVRLDMQNLRYSAALDYELIGPDGTLYKLEHKDPNRPNATWRWSAERVARDIDQLVFQNGKVYTKNYQKTGAKVRSLLADERFGVTRTGRAELESIFGESGIFDFPKPVRLIKYLLRIGSDTDSVILDFFAGSGTTAQAAAELNEEDGGNRRVISVNAPEPTPIGSIAREHGYEKVSDITYARLIKVMHKFPTAQQQGLRYYRLAPTHP